MAGSRTLDVIARGNFSGLHQAMDQTGNKAHQLGQNLTSIGNSLTLGVSLPLAAAGAAAFHWASGTEEATNKINVVFGNSAQVITDFTETASEDLGISSLAALDAAGTFGNLFRAMEIGEQPAADMSVQLIQLASDLASFNNADPTQVLQALQSGLVGQVEPLRAFGVNLSETRIKQEALTLGLWDGTGALDAAAKAQAAYAIILKDTELAQGDFANTADSAANQIRTFFAQVQDLGAELGTVLVPIVQDVVGILQGAVEWFGNLSPAVQTTIVYMAALVAAIGPLLSVIGRVILFGEKVSSTLKLMGLSATEGGLALGALTIVIGALILAHQQHVEEINRVREAITGLDADAAQLSLTQELIAGGMTATGAAAAVVAVAYHTATAEQQAMVDGSWGLQQALESLEAGIRTEAEVAAASAIATRDAGKAMVEAATNADTLHTAVVNQAEDMRGRWEPALGSGAGASRDLAGAQGDLEGNVKAATGAIEAQQSTLRALTDPAFAAIQATQQYNDAQAALILVQGDSTASAADLEAAQLDVVAAYIGVQDATRTLRDDPASSSVFSNTIDAALGVRGQLQGVKTDLADINAALDKVSGRTVTFTVDGKVTSGAAAASFLAGRIGEYG